MIPGWNNFFEAEVGASASLAGLIFVGLSINISRIVALPRLPGRAIQALTVLFIVLIDSLLLLIPGQSNLLLGVELIPVGVAAWIVNTRFDLFNYRHTDTQYRTSFVWVVALDQICLLLYIISGVLVIFGATSETGIYLLVPATVVSFIMAILDAWVLLVEINR